LENPDDDSDPRCEPNHSEPMADIIGIEPYVDGLGIGKRYLLFWSAR